MKPGDTVAIVGAGPIGLATLLRARFYSPAGIIVIDPDENRLSVARSLGATATVNPSSGDPSGIVMKMTEIPGVDVAVEAVGVPASFITCEDIVAPGGTIANIGVHGAKVDLHLERLWSSNITVTTRLVDTESMPAIRPKQRDAGSAGWAFSSQVPFDRNSKQASSTGRCTMPAALRCGPTRCAGIAETIMH